MAHRWLTTGLAVGVTLVGGLSPAGAAGELSGDETWGARKAHPAVVNSVTAAKDDPHVLSLRGTWDFVPMPSSNQRNTTWGYIYQGTGPFWTAGQASSRNRTANPIRRIQVPGCWEAQLADDSVTTGRAWFCRWDCSPQAIRGYHSGDGWYRRIVTVPADWKGRRVWLKTGWVNSAGWFWVNGEQVALDRNYCATYKYEITDLVSFGETNIVVVQVNNEMSSHRGCANSKNHWGGILRDIELESTPDVFIDDAWVRGDFDRRVAEVHVEIEKSVGENGSAADGSSVRVTVDGATVTRTVERSGKETLLQVPLKNFRPWSPERPNLYTARVELVAAAGGVVQTRVERFGVRKLEVRGREVFLNGRPFYLRGAGWHAIDPIEGYAKPDREAWLNRARQVRAAGFNIVRNHTECKMPEFFEACDEAGLMVEAELPYYGDVPSDGQRFDPLADAALLYRHFRRYPSFAIYSFGNEGSFGPALSARIYSEVKARDPDRLVMGQDCGRAGRHPTNTPLTSDFAGGPIRPSPRGKYRPDQPYFYHEYVNSSVKLDSRVARGFTGVWVAPISRASRAAFLAPFGLGLVWGDRLQDGQNRMQKTYLKYGLESARLDGAACGYSYWSLQDACSPQGDTFIGQALWDPFWGEKRCGSKTSDVAVFNSPTCVLMTDGDDPQDYAGDTKIPDWEMFLDSTITNLVRTSGQTIRARFHLAHYGDAPLADARLAWRLVASDGTVLRAGERAIGAQPLGGVRPVASADIVVPEVPKAVKARLEVTVTAGAFRSANGWDYWLFPRRRPTDGSRLLCDKRFAAALAARYPGLRAVRDAENADFPSCDAVIAMHGSALEKAALAAGKRVVSLANQKGARNVTLGWWYMTEQMGAALKDHPILAGFPHEGLFEPQFFRIGKTGLKLPVEGFAEDDFVMVGEGGRGCYLYLAAAQRPNGVRQCLIAGLDVLSDTVEGAAILDGALKWAKAATDESAAACAARLTPPANVLAPLQTYVTRFNADDNELCTNAVPNADALSFLARNIPLFECPDADIERTYYFRWWTYRRHLKRTPDGFVVTEFLPNVPWAGAHNTINCAAGFHISEGRWLRDRTFVSDYSRFWFRKGTMSGPRAYVCWPATAILSAARVSGDRRIPFELLDALAANWRSWAQGWTRAAYVDWRRFPKAKAPMFAMGLKENGLFATTDDREGSENSLSHDGFRPLVNSAMWGEATAIAEIARLAGRRDLADEFTRKAADLERNMKEKLWNPERSFFTTLAPDGEHKKVRELFGYAPWYFKMPLAGFGGAWSQVMSTEGFLAPCGLTNPEQSAEGFVIGYDRDRASCRRDGPSWPYETCLVLTALANALQGNDAVAATKADYMLLLRQYAAVHKRTLEDGRIVSWIDEDWDPFSGDWLCRRLFREKGAVKDYERGRDYNHSTFCDLVISGVVGVVPTTDDTLVVKPLAPRHWRYFRLSHLLYHGHDVDIVYDRTGAYYGGKPGLVIRVDGEEAYHAETLPSEARVSLSPSLVRAHRGFCDERGRKDQTAFKCWSDSARLHFHFSVCDDTLCHPVSGEDKRQVEKGDRAEIFLAPTADLKRPYYCFEIDPAGHVLDYRATFYRQMDYDWKAKTLQATGRRTKDGYEVTGSIGWDELRSLGLNPDSFYLGAFRADFSSDDVLAGWYSMAPADGAPADFHRPVMFEPMQGKRP